MYLDDIHRHLCVLLKQQHGGGVCVYVELLQKLRAALITLVHVAEAHIVFEGKRCQLAGGKMRTLKRLIHSKEIKEEVVKGAVTGRLPALK